MANSEDDDKLHQQLQHETKIQEFRTLFEEAIVDIADKTIPERRCLILSGGVDTCAILKASTKLGITYAAGITVCCETSPDRDFATAAAKEIDGLPHYIVNVTAQELVQDHLPPCVDALHTFDGMTLRNSLVVSAAFQKAASLGFTDAIVGDAADELFGGYSFMWGNENDPVAWKEKRNKMCREWTFATKALAAMHGITSHGPYLVDTVKEWALDRVERHDCIAIRPIRLQYGEDKQDHTTGKLLLREAYDTVSSWRRKDPIEVGSGVTIIGKDDFWESILSDEEFEAEYTQLKEERGYNFYRKKEYLINFRAFEKRFGKDGETLPTFQRMEIGQGCVGCCFDIGPTRMFCPICGAYPAQRSAAATQPQGSSSSS